MRGRSAPLRGSAAKEIAANARAAGVGEEWSVTGL
jgi:hypothetical protein